MLSVSHYRRIFRDFGIPIKVTDERFLSELIELFDGFYPVKETLERVVLPTGDMNSVFEEVNTFKDNLFKYFEPNERLKKFISYPYTSIPLSKIEDRRFLPESIGKELVSVDLTTANFQTYYRLGIIKETSWNSFYTYLIRSYRNEVLNLNDPVTSCLLYYLEAKKLRQVLFGSLNSQKRVVQEQKKQVALFLEKLSVPTEDIYYIGHDEIVLDAKHLDLVNEVRRSSTYLWKTLLYTVDRYEYKNGNHVESFFTFSSSWFNLPVVKNYEGIFLPQILRFLKGELPRECDLYFMYDSNTLAKLDKPLIFLD